MERKFNRDPNRYFSGKGKLSGALFATTGNPRNLTDLYETWLKLPNQQQKSFVRMKKIFRKRNEAIRKEIDDRAGVFIKKNGLDILKLPLESRDSCALTFRNRLRILKLERENPGMTARLVKHRSSLIPIFSEFARSKTYK